MGDFYEMFMDDAIEVSKILQITLSKRGDVPMCGIPHHAASNYFYKLIHAGKKIAVAEQVEKPGTTKTILKREVVQIITPGTVIDTHTLEDNKHNFLLQLKIINDTADLNVAALDISTGHIECTYFSEGNLELNISSVLCHYEPKEILVGEEEYQTVTEVISGNRRCLINETPSYVLKREYGTSLIKNLYRLSTLKPLGLEDAPQFIEVLSGLIYYLKNNHLSQLDHVQVPKIISREHTMSLDHATITNLELVRNTQDNSEKNTLFPPSTTP